MIPQAATEELRRCPFCNARLFKVRHGVVTIEDKDGNRHTFLADTISTICRHCNREFETRLTN